MATERMRKRLDDSHGNSSTNINENFCLIGTPLPSLDSKKRDANEFKPIWQQEVYDDQGRRRFHGAFTGGYSAGYYNSVGSKEGWQPSTFRSSRKDKERSQKDGQQKTKYQQSTAEDFMDEEDLESFGNGRGTLKANEDFRLQHSKSDSHHDPLMGILRLQDEHNRKPEGSSESNIFINKSSLGTKILQRMGWKPGQGLGAWLPLDGLRRLRLLVGLPTKRDEGVASSSNLYPPPDTDMVMPPSNHTGAQGLGCNDTATPSNLAQLLERRHESNREQSISSRPQGGFGIGALEEDSDDEAEVYSTGHRMQDSTLDSKTKSIKRGRIERKEKPGSVHKISSDDNDKRGHWHDKSPMIPGFVLSDDVMEEKNNDIENILVPDAWQPDPNRVWKDTSSGLTRTKTGFIPPTSSSQRASSFGEAKIPGPPPSIADYLSIKDRERLEKAKAAAMQTGSLENVTFRDTKPAIPKIEPEIAKAALQGYIPFENDKEKQNRYRIYLQAQMNQDQTLKPVSGQRIDEFERELREFSRSAAIFKPMNTMMSSRFETALTSDQSGLQKMKPGLFLPSNVPASFKEKSFPSSEEDKDQKSVPDNLTSLQRNAKMGLFGPHTTRETKKWIPARLLCKRFNVPHPYPDEMANEDVLSKGRSSESFDEFGHSKGERKEDKMSVNARWEASKRQLQELAANHARKKPSKEEYHDKEERSSQLAQENSPTRNHDSNRKEDTFDLSSVGLGEVKGDIYESDYTKPSIDLFKSIFAQEERLPSNDELAKSDLDSTEQGTTQEMPSKLLFKPRKRSSTEDVDDSQSESIGNRKKKSDKIRSSKNQIRGSLTFNMEEEEEEEFEFQPKKLRKTKQ